MPPSRASILSRRLAIALVACAALAAGAVAGSRHDGGGEREVPAGDRAAPARAPVLPLARRDLHGPVRTVQRGRGGGLAGRRSEHPGGADHLHARPQPAARAVAAPPGDGPRPLLVVLHSWSTGYENIAGMPFARWAQQRGWAVVQPDYRGPFDRPQATGSGSLGAGRAGRHRVRLARRGREPRARLRGWLLGRRDDVPAAGRSPSRPLCGRGVVGSNRRSQCVVRVHARRRPALRRGDRRLMRRGSDRRGRGLGGVRAPQPAHLPGGGSASARADLHRSRPRRSRGAARPRGPRVQPSSGGEGRRRPERCGRHGAQRAVPAGDEELDRRPDLFRAPDPPVLFARRSGPVTVVLFDGEHDMVYNPGLEWMAGLARGG